MGRVRTLLDVGTFIKIAATAVVALLAFGAMATPAWAQDTTTLSVDKSADPDPVVVGQKLTYTIEVTNTGTNDAVGTLFSDDLVYDNVDVHLSSMSVSTTAGTCEPITDPTEVTCALGDLAPGQKATITIELVPTSTGTINNTAYAEAGNAPSAQDTVSTTVVPDLVIDKSAPGGVVIASPPERFTYTLRVTNQGETTADNVIVTDALPLFNPQWPFRPGVYFYSVTSDVFTCQEDANTAGLIRCEGSLAAGETAKVEIFVGVGPVQLDIRNTAQVRVEGVPTPISSDTVTTQVFPGAEEPGGEEPGNDKGEWVLVEHKGKELCLPKAALNGHLRHGDEVISEEGCSNAEDGGRRGLR